VYSPNILGRIFRGSGDPIDGGPELTIDWVNDVKNMMALLERGDSIYQIMQVTGEEGITLEDFSEWQKSMLLDMVYLQQDAFDEVDACMPRERQLASFGLLKKADCGGLQVSG